jgi:phage shock protein C
MYCFHCGKEYAADSNFCPACGKAARGQSRAYSSPRILRPRSPRVIAGVCAGLALHFGWNVMWTRILFTVFTLLTSGFGVIAYLVAWVALPDTQYALPVQVVRG